MNEDPVEKARLAWLGALFRFEKLVKGEPTDEEYQKAKAELKRAKQHYDQFVGGKG